MGGIGLSCRQPQPNTTHTYAHTHTYTDTHIRNNTPAHNMHTECTQYAHTQKHTNKQNNMQHIEQNTENNTEHTEQKKDTQNNAQPQHRCITYDLHKYSFDLYHEQIYINNSNTIELYTILHD